jgi:hypothetical protein
MLAVLLFVASVITSRLELLLFGKQLIPDRCLKEEPKCTGTKDGRTLEGRMLLCHLRVMFLLAPNPCWLLKCSMPSNPLLCHLWEVLLPGLN